MLRIALLLAAAFAIVITGCANNDRKLVHGK